MMRLLASMTNDVWLLEEGFLQRMCMVAERRIVRGERLSSEEIEAIRHEGPMLPVMEFRSTVDCSIVARANGTAAGGAGANIPVVAVLNITGILAQHSRQVQAVSGPGGTSTEQITNSLRAAVADPNVKGIVMNFDSPGGNVFGIEALSDEIYRARGSKPIVAQVNSTCASAAYWLATQCDEIVVTPGGQVGSIGAYTIHQDQSKKLENEGVKVTYISAGRHKVDGNSAEPLSSDAQDRLQKMVDTYYGTFVSAVARGRGVKAQEVRDGYGQGGMEHAKNAIKLGMADKIDTLDSTIRRVASGRIVPGSRPVNGTAAPSAIAANVDDFRRRRHAHRMRMIS